MCTWSVVTLLGELPAENPIEKAKGDLTSMTIEPGSAIVFALPGNYTYCYEQAVGGLVLLVPLPIGHHLLGDIGVVSDRALKSLMPSLLSLIGCRSDVPVVNVPPIPRFIQGGYCTQPGHSTNVGKHGSTGRRW